MALLHDRDDIILLCFSERMRPSIERNLRENRGVFYTAWRAPLVEYKIEALAAKVRFVKDQGRWRIDEI